MLLSVVVSAFALFGAVEWNNSGNYQNYNSHAVISNNHITLQAPSLTDYPSDNAILSECYISYSSEVYFNYDTDYLLVNPQIEIFWNTYKYDNVNNSYTLLDNYHFLYDTYQEIPNVDDIVQDNYVFYVDLHLDTEDRNKIWADLYYQDRLIDGYWFTSTRGFYDSIGVRNQIDFSFVGSQMGEFIYRTQNFDVGYNLGYSNGYNVGQTDGYSNGYTNGFSDGQEVNSTAVTIFNGILNIAFIPINFFLEIFNFEILGINLSAFVSAILSVCLVVIVIRFVTQKNGGDN